MPFGHYRLRRAASTSIKNATSGGGIVQLSKDVSKKDIDKKQWELSVVLTSHH
jgi:hypothetical protein